MARDDCPARIRELEKDGVSEWTRVTENQVGSTNRICEVKHIFYSDISLVQECPFNHS